jgi:hypothetical protein
VKEEGEKWYTPAQASDHPRTEEALMKRTPLILAIAVVSASILMPGGQRQAKGKTIEAAGLTAEARAAINSVGDDLAKLNASHQNLVKAVRELDGLYVEIIRKAQEVSRLAGGAEKTTGKERNALFKAIREMQEMQMSFNLQYLTLQNEISHENRQFSMVSNIMKNKHDTAKNSINNIR